MKSTLRPSAATLETVAASGRRRVHQGVQLDALLRAFRLGSKLIWAGMFPLKVDGEIAQCVSIEDYGDYNARDDGRIEPVDPLRRDWARLYRE